MYRPYSCLLISLLLSGCALPGGQPGSESASDSYEQDRKALFDQPYIDPLTDYLIEHQGDPARADVLREVRQERDLRCDTVAGQYAREPATRTVLERYNFNYGYSCPQQVADFGKRVEQPPTPDDNQRSSRQKASDQALSDCYLLTTIRNFSEAREACRQPADSGDVRSQANMAKIAHAFEDFASAVEWAKKSAQASAEAAFLLARMYASGQGVSRSNEQAVYWYTEAARQGHKEAQAALDRHSDRQTEKVPEGDT